MVQRSKAISPKINYLCPCYALSSINIWNLIRATYMHWMLCMFRIQRYLNMLPVFIHIMVLLWSWFFFFSWFICWKRTWRIANIESEWEIWMDPLTLQHYGKRNMYKPFFYLQNCTHIRGLTNLHSVDFYVNSVKLVLELARRQEFYIVKKLWLQKIFSVCTGTKLRPFQKNLQQKCMWKSLFP